ncbi:hypothetical protein ACPWR0_23360 [Pandoraea pneumonica]|uniref:hypothetical protein n=1 Tax=Pandoraea pneumonica TaxID=2508299 RepID=UPI003CF15DED
MFLQDKFSVGVEESTGKYYISIPVANPYVSYEEYYEIERAQYEACPGNLEELRKLAEKCRERMNDENIMMIPGELRGDPI